MAGERAWRIAPGTMARLNTLLIESDPALLSSRLTGLVEPRAA